MRCRGFNHQIAVKSDNTMCSYSLGHYNSAHPYNREVSD